MEKNKKPLSLAKAIKRTAPSLFRLMPLVCLLYMLLSLSCGVIGGLTAPAYQNLYDALANLTYGNPIGAVYRGAAIVTGIMLFQQLLHGLHEFVYTCVLAKKSEAFLNVMVYDKIKKLPAYFFEDKERLDDIEKARDGCWMISVMLTSINNLILIQGIYFVVMWLYLWSMRPLLVIAFLFAFVPVFLSQIEETRVWFELAQESTPIRRKLASYEGCLISRDKLKETRIYGTYYFFRGLYLDTLSILQQKEWSVQKRIAAISLGLNALKVIGWIGIVVLLFDSMINGYITIGAFAAVFAAIGRMFGIFEGIFAQIKGNISSNLGKIHNFLNLLDMDESSGREKLQPDFTHGIIAENVCFSYPNSDRLAVDCVSLRIQHGETVALVGENGSGKTTMVKLLMGLYNAESGRIVIGGLDSETVCDISLFSHTSAVFQDFPRYAFSLSENICLSHYGRNDAEAIALALLQAGIDYNDTETFPDGLNTVIQRDFGGVDLSGGQWQRVAIARGLYRWHDFIVFDEPTAAIDPIEETLLYKQFAEFSKRKTTVLVTHRLGSARIANRILVMDCGKVVESGTHESLLSQNGKYATMWKAQASGYREGI